MSSTLSASAKAILVGEHAVVHGQPAIALPLSQLRARVDAHHSASPLKVSSANAERAPFFWRPDAPDSADPLMRAITLTARYLAADSLQGELVIRSDIPVAAGLGSGAAVSAALARGVAALLDCEIPDADLNAIVYEVEKLHHGTPSGIDNSVVVYERPVYFMKERPISFLKFGKPATLTIADTGVPAPTRESVADVRDQFERQPVRTQKLFDRIGALVDRARPAFEAGDHVQLGQLMTRNHALLQALDLSSPLLDKLVAAALRGGAFGAKLSGGGRGGVVIALTSEAAQASLKQALLRAGAKRVIVSSAGGEATPS